MPAAYGWSSCPIEIFSLIVSYIPDYGGSDFRQVTIMHDDGTTEQSWRDVPVLSPLLRLSKVWREAALRFMCKKIALPCANATAQAFEAALELNGDVTQEVTINLDKVTSDEDNSLLERIWSVCVNVRKVTVGGVKTDWTDLWTRVFSTDAFARLSDLLVLKLQLHWPKHKPGPFILATPTVAPNFHLQGLSVTFASLVVYSWLRPSLDTLQHLSLFLGWTHALKGPHVPELGHTAALFTSFGSLLSDVAPHLLSLNMQGFRSRAPAAESDFPVVHLDQVLRQATRLRTVRLDGDDALDPISNEGSSAFTGYLMALTPSVHKIRDIPQYYNDELEQVLAQRDS
ncbi:hypothetical protein ACM66B_005322 [Microbotryomycetes sp. NB124-2]